MLSAVRGAMRGDQVHIQMRDASGQVLATVVLDESGRAVLTPGSQLDETIFWAKDITEGDPPTPVRREEGRRYLLGLRNAYRDPPLHAVLIW
jgi:hypothetical protein